MLVADAEAGLVVAAIVNESANRRLHAVASPSIAQISGQRLPHETQSFADVDREFPVLQTVVVDAPNALNPNLAPRSEGVVPTHLPANRPVRCALLVDYMFRIPHYALPVPNSDR